MITKYKIYEAQVKEDGFWKYEVGNIVKYRETKKNRNVVSKLMYKIIERTTDYVTMKHLKLYEDVRDLNTEVYETGEYVKFNIYVSELKSAIRKVIRKGEIVSRSSHATYLVPRYIEYKILSNDDKIYLIHNYEIISRMNTEEIEQYILEKESDKYNI